MNSPRTRLMAPGFALANIQGPSSIDVEARTVSLIWSTGAPVMRSDGFGNFMETLSMSPEAIDLSRLNNGAPLLNSHRTDDLASVIGVVESVSVSNGLGTAKVRFASDPASDAVFTKVKEGIIRGVSVGYKIMEFTDRTKKGDKITTLEATRWQPYEVSLTSVQADAGSYIRKNSETQPIEVPVVLPTNLETQTSVEILSTTHPKEKTKMSDNKAKRLLELEVERMVRTLKLDESVSSEILETEGMTIDQARGVAFAKAEERSRASEIRTHNEARSVDNHTMRNRGFEEALLSRVNPNAFKVTEAARPVVGQNMLRQLEYLVPRATGESDMRFTTRAMSTSDLPNILANVAEKSMRQAYMVQPATFKPFTKQGTLRNYKAANRLMLGQFPNLEKVNERGEFHSGAVAESKEVIQLARYGKSISFSKEMIINDDLNALSDFSTGAARSAARLESALVYTNTLLANPNMSDGNGLFSSAHNNLASTPAAISVASVSLAWNAMSTQKTLDGLDFAYILPRFLIVGPSIETVARQFVSTALLATQLSNINPYAGRMDVIVDPRITDNSWYLAADPAQIDTIEVARLEGEDGPIIIVDKGMTVGSILITCEHNVGAAALDYRGLFKNAGV